MSVVKEKIIIPDFHLSPRVDQVGVEERALRFTKRSIKKESKVEGLKLVLSMIDLRSRAQLAVGASEQSLVQIVDARRQP